MVSICTCMPSSERSIASRLVGGGAPLEVRKRYIKIQAPFDDESSRRSAGMRNSSPPKPSRYGYGWSILSRRKINADEQPSLKTASPQSSGAHRQLSYAPQSKPTSHFALASSLRAYSRRTLPFLRRSRRCQKFVGDGFRELTLMSGHFLYICMSAQGGHPFPPHRGG